MNDIEVSNMNINNINKMKKKEKITQKHISFSVSAGAYPYLMGVACYLAENYNLENIHFSGNICSYIFKTIVH